VHQAVDYAVGFALAMTATRSPDMILLASCAIAVIVSTAMFDGPLAAFKVFSITAHRVCDVALAIIGTALAVAMDAALFSRVLMFGASAVLVTMSVRFAHDIRAPRT
jgi:hypothetical protein